MRWIFVLAVVVLGACTSTAKPIGSTVKGTRIAVMAPTKSAVVDTENQIKIHPSAIFDNAAWPQAGYDTLHMMPNAVLADRPHEVWRTSIGKGSDSDFKLLARPVASHGKIFTMDSHGLVTALVMASGEKLWETDTAPPDHDHDAIGGGLSVDADVVYATTGFGEVMAMNAETGAIAWRKSVLNPVRAAPAVADGHVYVMTIDNQLSALDAANGQILWHHNGIAENAALMGAATPAVVGDSVIVAYSSGEIFDLRSENGRVAWNFALGTATQVGALPAIADIRGMPVVDKDRVFAVSHSGRMAAIDRRTGERAWEADIGGINTPVVSGNAVFVLSNDSRLVALVRESGRVIWAVDLPKLADPADKASDPIFWTGPVLANDRLWLVNSMGHLASFSSADGSSEEAVDLETESYVTPIIADRTMYVVTDDGDLVALR